MISWMLIQKHWKFEKLDRATALSFEGAKPTSRPSGVEGDSARPDPGRRETNYFSQTLRRRMTAMAASPRVARTAVDGSGTVEPLKLKLSMPMPWSLLASLNSTQRIQRLVPLAQLRLEIVPPRPAVRFAAALPSRPAAVAPT